jgi:hypothetical protein
VSAVRRGITLSAIAAATFLGLTATPALAGLAASATFSPVTVSTPAIAPPITVRAVARCGDRLSLATVTWSRSSTGDVTRYTVTAHRSNGATTVLTSTSGTSATTPLARGTTYSFTVTAVTPYGWTAESTKTGTVRC